MNIETHDKRVPWLIYSVCVRLQT